MTFLRDSLSHSTRVRGLKYYSYHVTLHITLVALYTSAWIEIPFPRPIRAVYTPSHSTRVRGLKCYGITTGDGLTGSHSTRVRGLKLRCNHHREEKRPSHSTRVRGLKWSGPGTSHQGALVALYTSAWIEMPLRLTT